MTMYTDTRCSALARSCVCRPTEHGPVNVSAYLKASNTVSCPDAAQLSVGGTQLYQPTANESTCLWRSKYEPVHARRRCRCAFTTVWHDGEPRILGVSRHQNPGLTARTPVGAEDTTFPMLVEPNGNGTRRPLPNLLSSFIPTASSMLPAALRSTPNPGVDHPSLKPPAMKRPRPANGSRRPAETSVGGPLATEARINARDLMPETVGDKMVEPPVRRSSRLTTTGKSTSRVGKLRHPQLTGEAAREKRSTRSQSVASSASGHTETAAAAFEAQNLAAVDDWLRDVVRRCARAYRALSLYQCQEALAELDGLPGDVQTTPWAYALAARCFYEMADYVKVGWCCESLLIDRDGERLRSSWRSNHMALRQWHSTRHCCGTWAMHPPCHTCLKSYCPLTEKQPTHGSHQATCYLSEEITTKQCAVSAERHILIQAMPMLGHYVATKQCQWRRTTEQ